MAECQRAGSWKGKINKLRVGCDYVPLPPSFVSHMDNMRDGAISLVGRYYFVTDSKSKVQLKCHLVSYDAGGSYQVAVQRM